MNTDPYGVTEDMIEDWANAELRTLNARRIPVCADCGTPDPDGCCSGEIEYVECDE